MRKTLVDFALVCMLVLSSPRLGQATPSVEVTDVVMFADPVWRSFIFRTDLDCRPSTNLYANELTKELKKALALRGVTLSQKGGMRFSLTIDQQSCGLAGEEKYTSYPLSLAHVERDISYAFLKVSTELVNKNTSEVISIREFFASAPLKNSNARILFLVTDVLEERVGLEDLWKSIDSKVIDALVEDLK